MPTLTELLDQLELYDFADAAGRTMEATKTFAELRALADDMAAVTGSPMTGLDKLIADRAALDPNVPKPAPLSVRDADVILSVVHSDDPIYSDLVVGWNSCSVCFMHIKHCTCKAGPTEPPSVQMWRKREGYVPKEVLPPAPKPKRRPIEAPTPEHAVAAADAMVADPNNAVPTDADACVFCEISVEVTGDNVNGSEDDDGTYTCFACQEEGTTR